MTPEERFLGDIEALTSTLAWLLQGLSQDEMSDAHKLLLASSQLEVVPEADESAEDAAARQESVTGAFEDRLDRIFSLASRIRQQLRGSRPRS